MSDPRLLASLPELVRGGLITTEQADNIRVRYAAPREQSGNRLLVLFSMLGGLLIGLGLILVVAHNWDDLGKEARTVFAFLPMGVGQALVLYTLLKKPEVRGWREGSATFLLFAAGACMALISQIYHIPGALDGFLLTWSLLVVVLLYVPGSLLATYLYLAMITWYALALRWNSGSVATMPWLYLPLLALAVPVAVQEWRTRGTSAGFFWLCLVLAVSVAIVSQLFWQNGHIEMVLGIVGLATVYCLVPWMHAGRRSRTGAFPFIGGAAMLGSLFFLSYRDVWSEFHAPYAHLGSDIIPLVVMVALGGVLYALSLKHRRPMQGTWLPEGLGVVLLAYLAGTGSTMLATILVNAWLLAVGLHMVISGVRHDSLPRMNLGLAIVSLTIVLRFFDLDINDALKGLVFIALGVGFLLMNVRLIKQRKQVGHA